MKRKWKRSSIWRREEKRVREIAKYVSGKFKDDDNKKAIGLIPNAPILNIKEKITPDDAADALAIAICHAHAGSSKISKYYNKKQTYGKVY